ncbi:MAG: dihydroorotase [Lachnospiraceae bacterium]|nr:dihydroorotase [Lachnospiraceae bacterium]
MRDLFIKNARIVDPRGVGVCNGSFLIRDDRIERIFTGETDADARVPEERSDPEQLRVIDADGWLAFPGLIDAHVHFRDPGFTDKEDIGTGAAAAGHGGFTSVIMMGNTDPPMDEAARVRSALEKGRQTGIRVYVCGNVTTGMKGQRLADLKSLRDAGAVLFSDDGLPVRDAALMEKACKEAAALGMVISLHEEDPAFIDRPGVNSGPVAASLGTAGADRQAEIDMVARDIAIAEKTGAELTVQHISARESVQLIRDAREKGLRIHAEATPHHFTLTEEAVREHGTNAKMNPPLREEVDRQAIIAGLADGTIDMIATDHAPHTAEEKARTFLQAPSGIIGLETALSLAYRELVLPGHLTWPQVIERMTAAFGVYGLPGGVLTEKGPADLTLFAPDETWTVSDGTLRSKARNTPFFGETLPGVVKYTICAGRIVWGEE